MKTVLFFKNVFPLIALVAVSCSESKAGVKKNTIQNNKNIKTTSVVTNTSKAESKGEDVKEAARDFKAGIGAGYSVYSDFAEEKNPRVYSHSVGINGSVGWKSWISTGASLNWSFESLGLTSPIFDDAPQNKPGFGGSWWASTGWGAKLGEAIGGMHSFSTSLSFAVPFGEDSRFAGVRSSLSTSAGISSSFFDKTLTISNGVGGSYTFHSYNYSPSSNRANADYGVRYRLGLGLNLGYGFSVSIGGGVGATHYFDDHWFTSLSTSNSISYGYKFVSASISYSNGYHIENGKLNLWLFDQYRQELSFSASVGF